MSKELGVEVVAVFDGNEYRHWFFCAGDCFSPDEFQEYLDEYLDEPQEFKLKSIEAMVVFEPSFKHPWPSDFTQSPSGGGWYGVTASQHEQLLSLSKQKSHGVTVAVGFHNAMLGES